MNQLSDQKESTKEIPNALQGQLESLDDLESITEKVIAKLAPIMRIEPMEKSEGKSDKRISTVTLVNDINERTEIIKNIYKKLSEILSLIEI